MTKKSSLEIVNEYYEKEAIVEKYCQKVHSATDEFLERIDSQCYTSFTTGASKDWRKNPERIACIKLEKVLHCANRLQNEVEALRNKQLQLTKILEQIDGIDKTSLQVVDKTPVKKNSAKADSNAKVGTFGIGRDKEVIGTKGAVNVERTTDLQIKKEHVKEHVKEYPKATVLIGQSIVAIEQFAKILQSKRQVKFELPDEQEGKNETTQLQYHAVKLGFDDMYNDNDKQEQLTLKLTYTDKRKIQFVCEAVQDSLQKKVVLPQEKIEEKKQSEISDNNANSIDNSGEVMGGMHKPTDQTNENEHQDLT